MLCFDTAHATTGVPLPLALTVFMQKYTSIYLTNM